MKKPRILVPFKIKKCTLNSFPSSFRTFLSHRQMGTWVTLLFNVIIKGKGTWVGLA